MLTLKKWMLTLLMLAIAAIPVMAGSNDAKTAKEDAGNTSSPEAAPAAASPSLTPAAGDANVTALLGVLVMKGVLAPAEANAIRNADPKAEFQLLVDALNRKGLLKAADLSAATSPAAQPSAPAAAPVAAPETTPVSSSRPEPAPAPQAAASQPAPPPPPAVVPAIAPVRVLAIDPPKKDGLVPAFKSGPIKMTPYGFIKATAVHDSSAPNGDDFPFVGLFLDCVGCPGGYAVNTGPTQDPEFHLKARSTRVGLNIEWPDASPKLTITGRIEGDYEGNFSEVDNRDVSSIARPAFQLRLAYGRLDYAANANTSIFFEGGEDWSLFGSTALPNILETTFLGAFYGDIYERTPQMMVGFTQKMGPVKVAPTFAIMMPTSSQILKLGAEGLAGQIGEAEREGADSGRPEFEGRLAFQFQLDKAPGVAPAAIFWSGFRGKRTSIVDNTAVAGGPADYDVAPYTSGFTVSSKQWGNQIGLQLPTRWFTLVGSAYFGGDMRFFFGGQVNSFFTDTGGLFNPQSYPTADGGTLVASGGATLACNVNPGDGPCPAGNVVIAPEKPVRSFGGFVNLGLPLSRWFNANPKGRNAGWQLYLHAGKDQVVRKDLLNPVGSNGADNFGINVSAPLPLAMGKVFAATLYYKLNPYVTFGLEQSVYGTRLACPYAGPCDTYTIAGSPDNLWQDHRTEFGPVFTF